MFRKKNVYWILALAVLLIFTACGSSAKDSVDKSDSASSRAESLDRYHDKKEIGSAYREAVLHMTEQEVLQGYDDGNFHPAVTLTREQGAKIVTYLLLDSEQAEALTCEEAPYEDVAADRWSAACIAWCTERHILDGYGDGNYGPEDSLTGRQFAKMLLCAYELGTPSLYLGNEWKEHVSADGREAGLFNGDEAMDSDSPLQRQQAALMADNAQAAKEKTVEGSSGAGDSSADSADSNGTSSGTSESGDLETPAIDITSEGGAGNGGSVSSGSGGSSGENGASSSSGEAAGTDNEGSADQGSSSGNPSDSGSSGNGSGNPADGSGSGNSSQENVSPGNDVVVNENGDILLPEVP